MLPCTKITNVENLSPTPFYWSETVSVRIELSFDNSANEDFKTLLVAENASQMQNNSISENEKEDQDQNNNNIITPQKAWICAIRNKLSQAVVTSTQVRQSPTSTNFTNSYALERPTFASTSHPSSQRQYLSCNAESYSSDENNNNNNNNNNNTDNNTIEFGFKDGNRQQPTATFVLNFAIPYSCKVTTSSSANNTTTSCVAANDEDVDETTHQSSYLSNSSLPSYFFCEWEILLLTKELVGPYRSQSVHFSPFAIMRHAVQVSSAVSVSAQVVPCTMTTSSLFMKNDELNHTNTNRNSSIGQSLDNTTTIRSSVQQQQQHQQQQNRGPSCLVAVTCKNSCDSHVILRHVELESPNNWSPAFVKEYYSTGPEMMMNQNVNDNNNNNNNNNLAQPVARDYNYYSSNHSSLNNLSDLNSSTYNTNQQNGGGNSSQATTTTVVADPWIVRRRTDGQRQFLYFYENQLQQQQNNSKRRNQTQQQQQQRNNNTLHAPVMNVRTSHQDLVSLSDSLPITLKPSESYTFCFECHGWDFVQQRLMLSQNKNNNTEQNITSRNASDVFAHSMISLFIARSTVAGRPVLLNHPVKV